MTARHSILRSSLTCFQQLIFLTLFWSLLFCFSYPFFCSITLSIAFGPCATETSMCPHLLQACRRLLHVQNLRRRGAQRLSGNPGAVPRWPCPARCDQQSADVRRRPGGNPESRQSRLLRLSSRAELRACGSASRHG